MNRDDDALGGPYFAPTTFVKIRAKRAELEAAIAAGTITRVDAAKALADFKSLSIAHHREHGSDFK